MARYALPAFGLGLLMTGGAAFAADWSFPTEATTTRQPDSQWIVTLKGNGIISPDYLGAKDYTFTPFPSIGVRKATTPYQFSAPDDGIGIALFQNEWFNAGPVARYRPGRYLDGNRELYGLDKVKWTIEGGAYAEVWPTQNLRGRVEVRHGFRDADGWVGDLAADFVMPVGNLTLSAGPRMMFGNGKFMRTNFGVTADEAYYNWRVTPYKPSGGMFGAGVAAAGTYKFNDNWSATLQGSWTRLVQDASKSPIVRNIGSKDQFVVGLSAAYSFYVR
ncbi:MAG: MipA/OmpV family protein [Chelatococcus sp.]|uniref:MipA/OmpV family protein n=1 Tax=unclassified Chelatococcus TaxID=2638111 RepID=UPI001BCE11EB|nr:MULTISPECIES: MipA/OmpV family protein [unclassified Chelatococcus]CAH1668706.1 Outer membrane scaffolding protein for murein synthesis (MipA/OmpV family) [Hyphomicrobiales bacterium]MBS7738110.1 MipA/OmpV family protein [Chelatococcus sp. HY11]MBX3536010.1 MipA/OmpV family protein [Chelatococcus sp.]MBX3546943.1 MipA/OmpV family protein [Chelatococcus sp.]MCO5077544.1 MipA/OmpV family protein [Chelatococcus sp.]